MKTPEHDGKSRIILPGQQAPPSPPQIGIAPYNGTVIFKFEPATSGFVLSWVDANNLAVMIKKIAGDACREAWGPDKVAPDEPAVDGQASAPGESALDGAGDDD